MTKTQSILAIPAIMATLLAGGAIAGYATLASAQTATTGTAGVGSMVAGMGMGMKDRGPHVHGTVSAVSGTTLTITDERSSTTYTIDASTATFKKAAAGAAPTTVTISEIAVGDKIGAMGTLSGTTLKATEVMEGDFGRGGMGGMHGMGGHGGRGPAGAGGPGVMGKVTAVSGSTITVTDRDGKSFTVNAGSATVQKMTTGALSDIAVGDTIGVHGDVSGTTVTAKTIMDDVPTPPAAPTKTQ